MVNLLKEIGRKITLIDLIEDTKETSQIIDASDFPDKDYRKKLYVSQNRFRGLVRLHGDALGLMYASKSLADSEHTLRYCLLGAFIAAGCYTIEYLITVWKPNHYKNGPQ